MYSTIPSLESKDARELRKKISEERLAICRANSCGRYDPDGSSEEAAFKGEESCRACGCPLQKKTMALSDCCGLVEEGKEPLWPAVLTGTQEEELEKKLEKDGDENI